MATDSHPVSPFPFLSLPSEIRYKICSLFCRHCQTTTSPSAMLTAPAGVAFQTLKALSETCHSLNEIAQPILYHFPDVKVYTSFFKTLIGRPDLAFNVRVFATYYEADWDLLNFKPPPDTREDKAYLIQLGQKFNLGDDGTGPDCASRDLGARDDVNFGRWFRCLNGEDDEDFMLFMASAAYRCFITVLHFAILPKLEFAMIHMCDGRPFNRHMLLTSGQLLFEFPYLKRVIKNNPSHFLHLRTIVFRSAFHYREESLGLETIAYLLGAIPNVRVVLFDLLRGKKPCETYRDLDPFPEPPELGWSVLPQLDEIYFDPCVRPENRPPILAISNMLERCVRLKKLVYRHKYPDQYNPVLFAPIELLYAISSRRSTLQHLEIYCNNAKIPCFESHQLLDYRLKDFTLLKTLALDEQLFCRHWQKGECVDSDACLTDILPQNVSSLTVRLHDKFKAVPDIIRLGRDKALGHYPQLLSLSVRVLHDAKSPSDGFNMNQIEGSFDAEYLLYDIPPKQWEETLRQLVDKIRPSIVESFQNADGISVSVEYLYEDLFGFDRMPYH